MGGKHHDLYLENFDHFKPEPNDILIGYSMGGRIAMEIAERNQFKIKRLIILSAHPGLETHELRERNIWEESVLQRLKDLTPEAFLTYWNQLPLFKADSPLNHLYYERFKLSYALFEKNRLSRQPNFVPGLLKHKEKVTWIVGSQDEKYLSLAKKLESQGLPIHEINSGHRVLNHPAAVMEALRL